jgi:hypothetical protein
MRFTVDPWDPSYGASVETDLGPSDLVPHPDVERPRDEWAPVDPSPGVAPPEAVLFVDGVRRTDAQVWVDEGDAPSPALCASYAAGVVCCCADGAHLVSARVERGLFGTHPDGADVVTWAGTYGFEHTTGQRGTAPAQVLSQGVQTRLAALELTVAVEAREHSRGSDLVVVDGQLRGAVGPPGAGPLPRTLGFVKTHSRTFLPPDLNPVVAALRAGQRTPVFRLAPAGEDDPLLTRFTWYLRLPCPPGSPWAGVARVECSGQVPVAEAVALADTSQVTLVRFASTAYKDSRAPQNLFPIAGLERALRRRLGEPALLYRALRSAAHAAVAPRSTAPAV